MGSEGIEVRRVSDINRRFEDEVLPSLDAAYSLARWLVRDEHVAEDLVQDAFLRAYRYFASFRGDDARSWLLGIVRNRCYSWFAQQKRTHEVETDVDAADVPGMDTDGRPLTPETLL